MICYFSNKKKIFVLVLFLLILAVFIVFAFNKEAPTQNINSLAQPIETSPHSQFAKSSPLEYECRPAGMYYYDFDDLGWINQEIPFYYKDPGGWNVSGYCSHRWSFKHPIDPRGIIGSEVCAMQVCKKIDGIYMCQGDFSLDQIVNNAVAGITDGWLIRPCFTASQIKDEDTCTAAGGIYNPPYCSQLDAVRNWMIDNEVDCDNAGGFWIADPWFVCMIPQDLLVEINPDNPDANCSVEGEEACAVLRWLKRPAGSVMRMVTLNIGQR